MQIMRYIEFQEYKNASSNSLFWQLQKISDCSEHRISRTLAQNSKFADSWVHRIPRIQKPSSRCFGRYDGPVLSRRRREVLWWSLTSWSSEDSKPPNSELDRSMKETGESTFIIYWFYLLQQEKFRYYSILLLLLLMEPVRSGPVRSCSSGIL